MQQRILTLATIIGSVGVILGTTIFVGKYFTALHNQSHTLVCHRTGTNFTDVIQNDSLSLVQINGKLCDTLTIINNDPRIRLIAFGPHDAHQAYDGVTEKILNESQSFTVTFNKTGTFTFHDHDDESIKATFTVSH